MGDDITWDDTPGETLPSRSESIDFTATRRVTEVRAVYKEEYAYQTDGNGNGSFVAPFLESSISGDGQSVSLKRTGGWNQKFRVYPVLEGGGGPATSLQPLNGSPLGAWALDGGMADRSGNGHTLNDARTLSGCFAPSRVPGKRGVLFNGCSPFSGYSGYLWQGIFSSSVINNPFTFAFWFSCFGDLTAMNPTQNQLLLSTAGFGSLERVILGWNITASPPGKLFAYYQPTSQAGVTSLNVPRDWGFITVRQRPDGYTRIGVNASFETVNIGACPASQNFTIGQSNLGGGNQQSVGGILSDMIVWPEEKSDDFLIDQFVGSGGVVP